MTVIFCTRLVVAVFLLIGAVACSKHDKAEAPVPQPTPSNAITPADIAKLKWIEGTWRGEDGDKPFYERYRFEGDTIMIVETFADETLSRIDDTSRFELRDGQFGHSEGNRRSAASSITADAVQFVPAAGAGNSFRFERQPGGKWRAVLDWPATADKPAGHKIYEMNPWPPQSK
jgi:hypothetical protein